MSENTQASRLDHVTQVILDELALCGGGGVSLDGLAKALAGQPSDRTVPRRVLALAEAGLSPGDEGPKQVHWRPRTAGPSE